MPKCIVCEDRDVRELLSYDKYPLCIGVMPLELQGKVKSFPLAIGRCNRCGHIQQINTVTEEYKEVIYKNDHSELLSSVPTPSKTGIGKSEAEECFNFFKSCNLPLGKALDIGCYDGYFLSLVKNEGYDAWGVEPNPISIIAEKKYGIPIIRDFFSEGYFEKNSFDVIILRNILEHIVEVNDFLIRVNKVLKPDGHMIIEVPNTTFHLQRGTLGGFFHQHLSYFSLGALLYLLSRHCLECVNSYEDYFMYLCVKKAITKKKEYPLPGEKSDISDKEVEQYFFEYNKKKKDLRELLEKEENVAVFGAGGHTTGLVHMIGKEFAKKKIKYVYDNNPLKHGNTLADVPVIVRNPEAMKVDKPDILIISTNLHQEAIFSQIRKMKLSGPKIVALYPAVKVERL